jgi:AraC family transcriptional regulator
MTQAIEEAVMRVIAIMRENLGERLTVDDMARTAMYSKFHFSRTFQQVTGISPGRFLSAMRLEEAKRLLVSTSLSVTEISHRVGYTSVGTFGSRFASSVGIAPTMYRQTGGIVPRVPAPRPATERCSATVHGAVLPATEGDEHRGTIFVGLFAERIPQGMPVRCAILREAGTYVLDDVPQGTWYVLVHATPDPVTPLDEPGPPSVGSHGPITITEDTVLTAVDVRLRPMHVLDPPVLLAVQDS